MIENKTVHAVGNVIAKTGEPGNNRRAAIRHRLERRDRQRLARLRDRWIDEQLRGAVMRRQLRRIEDFAGPFEPALCFARLTTASRAENRRRRRRERFRADRRF